MNKTHEVFLSLLVVIALGLVIDMFVINYKKDHETALKELNGYSKITFNKDFNGQCDNKFSFKKHFKAEKEGKMYTGNICSNDKEALIEVNKVSELVHFNSLLID